MSSKSQKPLEIKQSVHKLTRANLQHMRTNLIANIRKHNASKHRNVVRMAKLLQHAQDQHDRARLTAEICANTVEEMRFELRLIREIRERRQELSS